MVVAGRSQNRRRPTWRRRPEDMALRDGQRRLAPLEIASLVLAAICAGAALALGGAFVPLLDFFSHLEPFYLPAGAALIVLTLVPGERRLPRLRIPLLALGVLAVISSLWLVGPELAGLWSDEAGGGPSPLTLKVLTQNAWEHNFEIGATTDGILKANADVVMLQELDGAIRVLPQKLAAAYPYRADCTVVTQWCSLAILSKRPILSWTHHEAAWQPPDWDRLSLVEATIDGGPGHAIPIYTTHLLHPDGRDAAHQQTDQFLRAVGGADTRLAIIGGDFNRPPWSFALHQIDAAMPVPRRTHGLFSWPNRLPWGGGRSRWPFPFLPLDQIYAGRDWRVVDVSRAPSTGSDHYGVVATLALKSASP
jgi:endonuclease/exonuclease/phosphatase (EEP) superfamily protein YafD